MSSGTDLVTFVSRQKLPTLTTLSPRINRKESENSNHVQLLNGQSVHLGTTAIITCQSNCNNTNSTKFTMPSDRRTTDPLPEGSTSDASASGGGGDVVSFANEDAGVGNSGSKSKRPELVTQRSTRPDVPTVTTREKEK